MFASQAGTTDWIYPVDDTEAVADLCDRLFSDPGLLAVARAGACTLGLPVMVNVAARQLAEALFLEQLVDDWDGTDWATRIMTSPVPQSGAPVSGRSLAGESMSLTTLIATQTPKRHAS